MSTLAPAPFATGEDECSQLKGLRRRICEGSITYPVSGARRVLTESEQKRYLAAFDRAPVPPLEGESTIPKNSQNRRGRKSKRQFPKASDKPQLQGGVGSEIKNILTSWGIPSDNCGCMAKAVEWDTKGVGWCDVNRPELAGWLRQQAETRLREGKTWWKSALVRVPGILRWASESAAAYYWIDQAIGRVRARIKSQRRPVDIAVGVTTAPRQGPLLLSRCLDSLVAAGFPDITVFAEPESPLPYHTGVEVVQRSEKLGAWRNWMQTLEDLLAGPHDTIMIVQDDCVFARGVRDFLEAALWPAYDCGAIQLCCSSYYKTAQRGVYPVTATVGMIGAWATVMHRFWASKLLKWGRHHGWRGHHDPDVKIKNPAHLEAIDDFIGIGLLALGASVVVSFVPTYCCCMTLTTPL